MVIRNTLSTATNVGPFSGQLVVNFATWLQTQGIGSVTVAIASRNYPEWIFAYWGVIAVGGQVGERLAGQMKWPRAE